MSTGGVLGGGDSTSRPESLTVRDGVLRDNLVIKGNNLIALHCLRPRFTDQVKLIYIDPPYNTGTDGFAYNNRFSRSSWLLFMKNRLEAAKPLLRPDGLIFVSIDDHEQAYLKVLMDEVFGVDKFIACLVWQQFHTVKNDARNFSGNHEYILVYGDRAQKLIKNLPEDKSEKYTLDDNDGKGPYKHDALTAKSGTEKDRQAHTFSNGITWQPPSGRFWAHPHEKLECLEAENKIYFNKKGVPMYKRHLKDVQDGKKPSTFWVNPSNFPCEPCGDPGLKAYNIHGDREIKNLFGGEKVFRNPKPETLIKRILEVATDPGDIVLDYHAGTGTTAAVAHKLGRQYIAVEQLSYIEDITVTRLRQVVDGEQGGVSKDTGWKGGGEFIYFELAESNLKALKMIKDCGSLAELEEAFRAIMDRHFPECRSDPEEFINSAARSKKFTDMPLDQQKLRFIQQLDMNQLYVSADEMRDSEYALDKRDIELTDLFYSGGRHAGG